MVAVVPLQPKKGLGVAGGSSTYASTAAKGKSKEKPTAGAAILPPPLTCAPLDLPTAHSPMNIDYEAATVSAASSIPMGRPLDTGRVGDVYELHEEADIIFKEFGVHLDPACAELIRRLKHADDDGVKPTAPWCR